MADSATYTPEAIARRMQIAQQLLDFSKQKSVAHWAQGLDELAKGAVGGALFGQAEESERKGRYESSAAMMDALGLPAPAPYVPQYRSPIDRVASLFGGAGGAGDVPAAPAAAAPPPVAPAPAMAPPPAAPAGRAAPPAPMGLAPADIDNPNSAYNKSLVAPPPAAAPVALQRPEVMPTPKVWGDAEAEAAGLYEPRTPRPAGPPPTASTGALADMPLEKRRQIAVLLSNPGTQAMGQTLLTKALGESGNTDEIKEYNLSAQQDRQAGRTPPSFYDWKTGLKKAGAQNISIDQKGETAFEQEAGKVQAKRFNELAEGGQGAKQMLSDMSTLVDLGRNIGTGKTAEAKAALGPWAEALGIKVEGLSDIQAYESIVNRVAPSLRIPGSGTTSDRDLTAFMKSFQSLGNTPEGNEIIRSTLDGLYQNKVRAAEIGAKALTKEITRTEAEKQLRELPDPMGGYREFMKKSRGAPNAAGTPGVIAGQPTPAAVEAEMKRRGLKP